VTNSQTKGRPRNLAFIIDLLGQRMLQCANLKRRKRKRRKVERRPIRTVSRETLRYTACCLLAEVLHQHDARNIFVDLRINDPPAVR
jgi:hypothetical protein